jgi:hypothetical protein
VHKNNNKKRNEKPRSWNDSRTRRKHCNGVRPKNTRLRLVIDTHLLLKKKKRRTRRKKISHNHHCACYR